MFSVSLLVLVPLSGIPPSTIQESCLTAVVEILRVPGQDKRMDSQQLLNLERDGGSKTRGRAQAEGQALEGRQ